MIEIVSKHELNVGSTSTHPDKDRVFGYAGGTQRSWFAPDVGLVRVLHEHANGHTSDMLLRSHEVRDGTGLTGLSVGSRWEYACVDQATGTEYEHFVRVAAKIGATWLVVFVTRATATCDG